MVEELNLDAEAHNQDWTKEAWDLPPYKSDEFIDMVQDLKAFRKLPVYIQAVDNGLITDDEWTGPKVTV